MVEKYKISLWKDVPKTWSTSSGSVSYIGEQKVADIGSNTMTSLSRARRPNLVNEINGTNTFTFTLYYKYIDTQTGKEVDNPFIDLICNESKIKVLWKNEWYDFIVKDIQESSDGRTVSYTCTDLFINELSKTGFNLEFAPELDNNQGTVQELGAKVLEGSDWKLSNSQDTIQQYIEEPVYELSGVEVSAQFTAYDPSHKATTIPAGSTILLYYSVLRDKSSYLQFFYNGKTSFNRESSDLLTIDGQCYYVKNAKWTISGSNITCTVGSTVILRTTNAKTISTTYRAKRLVYSADTKFDPKTKKYVQIYSYNGRDIYKYIDDDYIDPTIVQNLLINSEEYPNLDGWIGVPTTAPPAELFWKLYPPFSSISVESHSYLRIGHGSYYNTAFQVTTAALGEGIQKGQKYIFRYQAVKDSNDSPTTTKVVSGIDFTVQQFDSNTKNPTGASYFSTGNTFTQKTIDGELWVECTATCTRSATRLDLLGESIGFFLKNSNSGVCWLKKVQFYPLVYGENAAGQVVRINPGDLATQGLIQQVYRYYDPAENTTANSIDEIKFLYVDTKDWVNANLSPKYNEKFEKIRSITEKNSNRFNLLQTLAETFECWVRFHIDHNEDGSIKQLYNSTTKRVESAKTVTFVAEIGQQVGIGFKYGIDLQTIQRTINSEQIATKIIVTPNSNEFGKDGFCSIARSQQNYPRENYVLNFDYYISHGLLDGGEFNRDLYLTTPDVIGYYYHLNENNLRYDSFTEQLRVKNSDLLKQQSFLTTYEEYVTSAQERKQQVLNDLYSYTGTKTISGINNYLKKYSNDNTAISLWTTYNSLTNSISIYQKQVTNLKNSIKKINTDITTFETEQEKYLEANKELNAAFYNKYSRYIQEGSWISEDYIDDDLYYMDAVSVAYTSSRPQVSYNINVLRLSALEEFKNKVFHLGDISYIEDTEFFGYVGGTPYRELVLISEISSNFDDPTEDSITVQNYRTQFEDLFQRITATTQSLQYATGAYQKAANAFEEDGTIKVETLRDSMQLNQEMLYSAQNESFMQDSTGITLVNLNNPNQRTKITSGGVFISTDGGRTWKNAIRGEGISTQYLTAGSINANNINIIDGNNVTFRWDSRGINAFSELLDEEGNIMMVNLGKFVRFDHYGIYGVDGDVDFTPESEDEIWDTAKYGMTWKGFFVRNLDNGGWVEVSSINDIAVYSGDKNNNVERIKIGRLSKSRSSVVYGIRIRDAMGDSVMETVDDGSLWLKKELNISSTDNTYKIQIGYLDQQAGDPCHRTIDVNDNFIVYEDGSIVAKNGTFTGIIEATGGTIGGVDIESVVGATKYRYEIRSSKGTVVKDDVTETVLTAYIYDRDNNDLSDNFDYVWYVDDERKRTGREYTLQIEKDVTKVYFSATERV